MDKNRLLLELHQEIRGCPLCRLAETRTHAVPGEGNFQAQLMFVGEGPGENEDLSGRPFIGAAGSFLNELLARAGIARNDVFITNIVKCRPPRNRDPLPDEVAACNDYLMAQIALIEPKFVVTLGSPAMKTLISAKLQISKVRCQVFRKSGIFFVPLFHPAAALHNKSLVATLQNDILRLKELIARPLRDDEIIDLSPPRMDEEPQPKESQKESDEPELSLF
ncbi:MAG TPA: uracil-DNA glycosylase [Abditibacteriaceae bacterium]|jgi:DNA polymerase